MVHNVCLRCIIGTFGILPYTLIDKGRVLKHTLAHATRIGIKYLATKSQNYAGQTLSVSHGVPSAAGKNLVSHLIPPT